jgi:PAS domain S-box-containing protein
MSLTKYLRELLRGPIPPAPQKPRLTENPPERLSDLPFATHWEPMWIFDQTTLAFLSVNEAAIRHYGYSRHEFLSMTIMDIRPREDVPALLMATMHPAQAGPTHGASWRHRNKDGVVFPVKIHSEELPFQGRRAELVLVQVD